MVKWNWQKFRIILLRKNKHLVVVLVFTRLLPAGTSTFIFGTLRILADED